MEEQTGVPTGKKGAEEGKGEEREGKRVRERERGREGSVFVGGVLASTLGPVGHHCSCIFFLAGTPEF